MSESTLHSVSTGMPWTVCVPVGSSSSTTIFAPARFGGTIRAGGNVAKSSSRETLTSSFAGGRGQVTSLAQPPKVIIMTASGVEDEESARIAGADGFLPKPFRLDQLLAIVDTLTGSGAAKLS